MKNLKFLKSLYINGYAVIPNFLSGSSLDLLNQEVFNLIEKESLYSPSDEKFYKKHAVKNITIVNPHNHSALIDTLIQTGFDNIASNVLIEPSFRMTLIQLNKANQAHGIPWHQDIDASLGAGRFYNFILYPKTLSQSAGGIKLVPHTHITQDLETGNPYGELEGEIQLLPNAGDLIIVDGCCFHSVPKNSSEDDRVSVVARYVEQAVETDNRLNIGVYRTGKFDYSTGKEVANASAT